MKVTRTYDACDVCEVEPDGEKIDHMTFNTYGCGHDVCCQCQAHSSKHNASRCPVCYPCPCEWCQKFRPVPAVKLVEAGKS